jgi:pyridoxine 5-phosphate synthase
MHSLPRLGVNIDHVATLRNARGENYPSPLRAALLCQENGADGITAHLREDRRHIRDKDIDEIIKNISIPFNFEMAPTKEMISIALIHKPHACCIVPEKREEITTEGGIDVIQNNSTLAKATQELKNEGIKVSLFIDAIEDQITASKDIGADIVEIHSGEFSRLVHEDKVSDGELMKISNASAYADSLGLEVHLGHGITFDSVVPLSSIAEIKEFNIGHFIVAESVFSGLKDTIEQFKLLIQKGRKLL